MTLSKLKTILCAAYDGHRELHEDRSGPSSVRFRFDGEIIRVDGEIDFDTYRRICAALSAGPSGPFARYLLPPGE
jgi:hypothetical protein